MLKKNPNMIGLACLNCQILTLILLVCFACEVVLSDKTAIKNEEKLLAGLLDENAMSLLSKQLIMKRIAIEKAERDLEGTRDTKAVISEMLANPPSRLQIKSLRGQLDAVKKREKSLEKDLKEARSKNPELHTFKDGKTRPLPYVAIADMFYNEISASKDELAERCFRFYQLITYPKVISASTIKLIAKSDLNTKQASKPKLDSKQRQLSFYDRIDPNSVGLLQEIGQLLTKSNSGGAVSFGNDMLRCIHST